MGLKMAAVPQANTSVHSPLTICASISSSTMARSCTVYPRCRPSVISESRVMPGRMAPSSAGVCNSPLMTANRFMPESS